MQEYISREGARAYDQHAIEELKIPGVVLMENAGRSASELTIRLAKERQLNNILIICGGGNNGGDGYVVARHLIQFTDLKVNVVLTTQSEKLQGDALINYQILKNLGVDMPFISTSKLPQFLKQKTLVVDAMLGTGFQGELRENIATLIDLINQNAAAILAIDIPSGLDANTGKVSSSCIKATQTITFVAKKEGFKHPNARDYTGEISVANIGI